MHNYKDVLNNIQKKIDLKKELRTIDNETDKQKIKKKINKLDDKIRSQPLPKL